MHLNSQEKSAAVLDAACFVFISHMTEDYFLDLGQQKSVQLSLMSLSKIQERYSGEDN